MIPRQPSECWEPPHPREFKFEKTHCHVHCSAVRVAGTGLPPKCSSVDKPIKEMWYTDTLVCLF